jgi:two-component system response regulator BaeR
MRGNHADIVQSTGELTRDRVLLVEDEPSTAAVLTTALTEAGFAVQVLGDGRQVLPRVRRQRPDVVLLDISLPGLDGFSVCRALRAESSVPVLMVTARGATPDRIAGLREGADDYLVKPVDPDELIARIRAVLRRTRLWHGPADASLCLDESARRATFASVDLGLTRLEFGLLLILARHPGRVYSRAQLLDLLSRDGEVADRTIDSHVRNLRRKLESAGAADSVKAVYGQGYRFEGHGRA